MIVCVGIVWSPGTGARFQLRKFRLCECLCERVAECDVRDVFLKQHYWTSWTSRTRHHVGSVDDIISIIHDSLIVETKKKKEDTELADGQEGTTGPRL